MANREGIWALSQLGFALRPGLHLPVCLSRGAGHGPLGGHWGEKRRCVCGVARGVDGQCGAGPAWVLMTQSAGNTGVLAD